MCLEEKARVLSQTEPAVLVPPPGVGKRQGGAVASSARGRRHTRPIVFSNRRCSFTRARLRLNGPPLEREAKGEGFGKAPRALGESRVWARRGRAGEQVPSVCATRARINTQLLCGRRKK
jgi:hypothetical protein